MAKFRCVVEKAWTGSEIVTLGEVRDLDPAVVFDENGKSDAWEPLEPLDEKGRKRKAPKLKEEATSPDDGDKSAVDDGDKGAAAGDDTGDGAPPLY